MNLKLIADRDSERSAEIIYCVLILSNQRSFKVTTRRATKDL